MWGWSDRFEVGSVLADAFLAGSWDEEGLLERAAIVLAFDRRPRWLRLLARRALAAYRERPADRSREFSVWIQGELDRIESESDPPAIRRRLFPELAMGRMRWPVPEIPTVAELGVFLSLHPGELGWLADVRSLERSVPTEKLRNYRYAWMRRPGGLPRLIERPKPLLKEVQRQILRGILDRVPPHPDAHGFRRGHSVLTNARRHVGRRVVLGFDLEDFFASVEAGRVYGIFRGAGYPESVAHRLTGICTNAVPPAAWDAAGRPDPQLLAAWHRLGRRLAAPHLPQGAPTSPALANLGAHGLDRRLSALASSVGAVYSRYADDLTFSGDAWLIVHQADVRRLVAGIVREEGFRLNERKSRLTTNAGRQVVTGVVVNERPNAPRHEYDRLKAILHDAARNGPATANRDGAPGFAAHLLGRIAWIESLNPARGAALRRRFGAIDWTGTPS